MNHQSTLIKTLDIILFTIIFVGKILFRISAATPIGMIIASLALKNDPKTLSLLRETAPLRFLLIGLQLTAPIMLVLSPLYDLALAQETHVKLTKVGWISYIASWIICFVMALHIPNIL